ncbi:hypothetical protein PV325_008757 [Microctonus aethiopoides]|uniref:Uncharacterized protein n=1 Tax=Microctonus aethiopoides TaxID=144406 RepID=A0AA39F7K8_9HYME|nr:hypothetical protein PV325_008757 [Microctonus aethiopoides]KAK0164368.1 hypothetical protein PV328_003004 [Microctonus aethiopoides]
MQLPGGSTRSPRAPCPATTFGITNGSKISNKHRLQGVKSSTSANSRRVSRSSSCNTSSSSSNGSDSSPENDPAALKNRKRDSKTHHRLRIINVYRQSLASSTGRKGRGKK